MKKEVPSGLAALRPGLLYVVKSALAFCLLLIILCGTRPALAEGDLALYPQLADGPRYCVTGWPCGTPGYESAVLHTACNLWAQSGGFSGSGFFSFGTPRCRLAPGGYEHDAAFSGNCPANSTKSPMSIDQPAKCTCNAGRIPDPTGTKCAAVDEQNKALLPEPCPYCKSNPIFPLTGAKKELLPTAMVLGGIELRLLYDSTPKASAKPSSLKELPSFGPLWRTNFHHRLRVQVTGTSALLSRGDGHILYFTGSSGNFIASGFTGHRLNAIAGGYLFTDYSTGTLETYDANGYLQTLRTAQGNTLTFNYSGGLLRRVADDTGRVVSFTYSAGGAITKILGPDSGAISATYDGSANLSSLTWQDGKTLTLLYEDSAHPWALTGKTDENGSRFATFGYDAAGRAILSEHAGGAGHVSVDYGTPPSLVLEETYDEPANTWRLIWRWQPAGPIMVTEANGFTSSVESQAVNGMPVLTSETQPAGSGNYASGRAQTFDSVGNMLSRDDYSGTRTCYAYDSSHREVTRIEGLATTVACSSVTPSTATLPPGARRISTTWHPDRKMPATVTEPLRKLTYVHQGQPDPFNGNTPANCTTAAIGADGRPLPLVCKRVEQALLSNGAMDGSVPARTMTWVYDGSGRALSSTDSNGKVLTFGYHAGSSFNAPFDPHFSQVALLLHADETNGSSVVPDSSPSNQTITAVGNASVSSGQSKFGSTSLAFDGNSDYVTIPASADFGFGAEDFTIEMFFYKNSNPTVDYARLWSTDGDYLDGANMVIGLSGNFGVYLNTTGTGGWTYELGTVATLANGQWYHLALVRSGGSVYAFVDGTRYTVTSAIGTAALFNNTAYAHAIGGQSGANRAVNGFIDEFRITKGVARYTSNFTPPTVSFPSTGPTMTATGHTMGDLQSVTNAAGHVTQFTLYDPAGRVRQMVDAKGIVTDIVYTPRGWVSTVTVTPPGGAGRTTTYSYDNVGQVTGVAFPDGTSVTYTYDAAHRLTGASDARGNTVTYTLDNTGNRTAEEVRDPGGTLRRSIARSFDALNRVQQVTGAAR